METSEYQTPQETLQEIDSERSLDRNNSIATCKSRISQFSRQASARFNKSKSIKSIIISNENENEDKKSTPHPLVNYQLDSKSPDLNIASNLNFPISPESLFSLEPRFNKIESFRTSTDTRSPFISPDKSFKDRFDYENDMKLY